MGNVKSNTFGSLARRCALLAAGALGLACAASPAGAEILVLRTNSIVEGEVYRKTDKFYYIRIGEYGNMRVPIEEIDLEKTMSVNYRETGYAPPRRPVLTPEAESAEQPVDDGMTSVTEKALQAAEKPSMDQRHPLAPIVDEIFVAVQNRQRMKITELLGQLFQQPGEGVKALEEGILLSDDSQLRSAGVVMIQSSEAPNANQTLLSLINQQANEQVIPDVLDNIDAFTHPELVAAAIKREPTLTDMEVRGSVLGFLQLVPTQQSVDYLCGYLGHPQLSDRAWESLRILFDGQKLEIELGDDPAVDAIGRVMTAGGEEPTDLFRQKVILELLNSLFEYRDFTGTGSIQEITREEGEGIAEAPARAEKVDDTYIPPDPEEVKAHEAVEERVLGIIRNRYRTQIKATLAQADRSKDKEVRLLGMQLAALARAETYVSAFIDLVEDEDADVDLRQQAARCLGEFGEKDAIRPLIELLKNQNRSLQSTAHSVLQAISGESHDAVYTQWLAWYNLNYENQ